MAAIVKIFSTSDPVLGLSTSQTTVDLTAFQIYDPVLRSVHPNASCFPVHPLSHRQISVVPDDVKSRAGTLVFNFLFVGSRTLPCVCVCTLPCVCV